jgi:hypothetical protein
MPKAAKSATQKADTSRSRKLAVKKDTLKNLTVPASGQAVKGGIWSIAPAFKPPPPKPSLSY